jgi:ABC-type glycerol-3-phosphate transport system substrate-binding protein
VATTVAGNGALAACAVGGAKEAGSTDSAAKAPATIVYWCNVGQSDWEKIQRAATTYGKKVPQHKIEATNDPGAEAEY